MSSGIAEAAKQICKNCGHLKKAHIHEEGACRPGFLCEAGCQKFITASYFEKHKCGFCKSEWTGDPRECPTCCYEPLGAVQGRIDREINLSKEATGFYISLLEREVEALRSVLSEWDEDKSHFIQMNLADHIRGVIYGLRRPT